MKTKHLRILTSLCLTLWATAQAADYTYETNNGTITITRYTGPGGAVIIPDTINDLPVTSIGSGAFDGCTNLTSVTIPTSVTSIGDGAFSSGYSLTSLTIPDSVISIGASSFSGCSSLMNLMIGNSVTSIGSGAFDGCTSLTNVNIPNSVTSIGQGAFWGSGLKDASSGLRVLPVNKSITITEYTGPGGAVTIPEKINELPVTSIGWKAFSGYSLTSLTIPNSVTSIGEYAFDWCNSLTNVNIPDSVTSIGQGAFFRCTSLTSVTIGNGVTNIGNWAFFGCTSLKGVYFKGNAPSSVGESIFILVVGGRDVHPVSLPVTVYYLPGTTGWGPTFGAGANDFSRPTALWVLPNPVILSGSVGIQTNGFGFIISWATNLSVVVEASTTLTNPTWSPVATNALVNGWFDFNDPHWTNHTGRFYRLCSE